MQFIVDTSEHRTAFGQKRLLFSWLSFYAGVGVALAVMLIAYNVAPRHERASAVEAKAAAVTAVAEQPAEPLAAPTSVTAAQVVAAMEAASLGTTAKCSALDHLRARGTEPMTAVDREYAAVAVIELSGKPRAEAERMVDAWLQMGKLLTR